jgi:hypothetical protein
MSKELSISQDIIENRIFTVRKVQVMIDYHLAELYDVETKRINEQVKRNTKRFPENFMFQLTEAEWNNPFCIYRTRCCDVISSTQQ